MNAGYKADTLIVSGSNNGGESWTEIGKLTTDSSYKDLTLDFDTQYKWVRLEVEGTAQVRVKKVTLTLNEVETTCKHTNTTVLPAEPATCTEAGLTEGLKCADCGEILTSQDEIPSTGHNYVDGVCTVCSAEKPEGYTLVTNASDLKVGDKIVIVAQDTNFAMSTDQKSNNRGQAAVEKSENVVTFGNDVQVFTLEAGTTTGTFAFNTGSGYLYAASSSNNYLRTQASIDENASWKIVVSTDGTSITAPNSSNRNVLQYNQSSSLFSCYASATQKAVVVYVLPGSENVESCKHTNTEIIPAVAATCSTTGLTEGVKCSDCGEILTAQEPTSVREHNMVNGICAYEDCGLYEHQADVMAAAPDNGDKIIIHHVSSNSALGKDAKSNDLAGIATTPVEGKLPYYTSVAILTVGKIGDTYTFANAEGKYLSTTGSNTLCFVDAADANSYWTIALTDGNFIITNAGTDTLGLEYYNGAFTTYTAGTNDSFQMALYLVEQGANACEHQNTTEQEDGYAPTCTQPGKTNSWTCDDCGATVTPQANIDPTGHSYVDDVCKTCGAAAPARYYIATYRDSENQYYYMTSDLEDNKRYQAVATNILPSKIDSDEALSNHVFILTDNGDGTYYLQAENVTGDNYLNHTGASNTGTYTSAENAPKLTISNSTNVEGAKNIYFTSDAKKYLSLNEAKDNNYFAWYKGTQKQDLVLIPVEKIEEDETITITLHGAADGITVSDNQILDLNGFAATNVTGTDIRVYDSSATYTKNEDETVTITKGTGTLTLTEDSTVITDNTVDGVRYIALKKEGAYTFHILEMKLSAVSLRTTAAGIYYKAIVNCDDTLAGAVSQYGIALSTRNMPGANFATESELNGDVNGWTVVQGNITSGQAFTSGSVFGIFKNDESRVAAAAERNVTLDELNALYGEVEIYANAYIKVGNTFLMADTTNAGTTNGVAWSLRDVLGALVESDKLTDKQKVQIGAFYDEWHIKSFGWSELDSINSWSSSSAS